MISKLEKLFEKYAELVGLQNEKVNEILFLFALLSIIIAIISYLLKLIKWLFLLKKQKVLQKDLHPFYTYQEIQKATNFFIQTKCQEISPSQHDEPARYAFINKSKLIPKFLKDGFSRKNEDDDRFYIILADAGMGKTTFMINLYLAYIQQWSWKRQFDIKLFPLGHPEAFNEIEKIKDKENTILLLDALDEDIKALQDYSKRMQEILQRVWKFREIVITCRTQFFPSREEEPYETGWSKVGTEGGEFHFRKMYISIFDNKDIRAYLKKNFPLINPFNWGKYFNALKIIQRCPFLAIRPMILSYIKDLILEKKDFHYTYMIYKVLIEKWVTREAQKPMIKKKYGSRENFKKLLLGFSQSLAVDLYINKGRRGGFFLYKDEKIRTKHKIQLSDLEEDFQVAVKNSDWRAKSLLNRNAEGFYKFSHKSILEYFLAKEAFENLEFRKKTDFNGMDICELFYDEMSFEKIINETDSTIIWRRVNKNLINIFSNPVKDKKIDKLIIRKQNNIDPLLLRVLKRYDVKEIVIVDKEYYKLYYLLCLVFYPSELDSLSIKGLNKLKDTLEIQQAKEELKGELRYSAYDKKLTKHQFNFDIIQQKKDFISNFLDSSLNSLSKKLHNNIPLEDWLELVSRLEIIKLQELIEFIKIKKLLKKSNKTDIDKLEIEEFHAKYELYDNSFYTALNHIPLNEMMLKDHLTKASILIKKCQILESKMPETKIFY